MKFSFTAPLIAAFALVSSSYTGEGKIYGRSVEQKVSEIVVKASSSSSSSNNNRALSDATPHTTIYEHIIGSEDNVFIPGIGLLGTINQLLGAVFYTSGGIYPNGSVQRNKRTAPNGDLFSGDSQPIKFPAARSNFFITGECTVTQTTGPNKITGHSCLYTLCLGGGGNNCVNGLAAGPFEFDLTATTTTVNANTGVSRTFPSNPPTFSGIILGGTGACSGIIGHHHQQQQQQQQVFM